MHRMIRNLLLLAFSFFVGSHPLLARYWCTNADFAGSWTVSVAGTVVQAPPIIPVPTEGPFAAVARLVSPGDGTFSLEYERRSYGGRVYAFPLEGRYSVNPDCTMSLVVNPLPPLNLPIPYSGVLFDDNKQMSMILVGPGVAVRATLRKQSIYWCSSADLIARPYLLELSGSIYPPSPQAGAFLQVGRLVFYPAGTFTAATNVSYNGLITPESISGTYTVDAECKLALNYTVTGPGGRQEITVEGVLSDRQSGVLMMTNPEGAAITGRLRRQ